VVYGVHPPQTELDDRELNGAGRRLDMFSNKGLARIAGGLYLIVAVCGGFSELYVRARVDVPGDAAATAASIAESETLFRVGALSDLVGITCFLVLALVLYGLLRPVGAGAATTMLVFIAVSVAVMTANMTYHLGALHAAVSGDEAGALRFLEMHHEGYLVAGIFFGLWLFPLGYLLVRSGYAPRALGILAMVGAFGYVADTVANVLAGSPGEPTTEVLLLPSVLAEVSLVLWLLVKGLEVPERLPRPSASLEHAPVAA
jgi:hypothetical protein